MAGENGPREQGGLTSVTYIFKTLMVSRKHILMLTSRNLAPWVFFNRLCGGTPEPV